MKEGRRAGEFFISMDERAESYGVESVVEEAFRIIERLTGCNIPRRNVGSKWGDGEFGSVEWYIKEAFNRKRNQVDADRLWDLVEEKPPPGSPPPLVLIIISLDMYQEGTNFVFGVTQPKIYSSGFIVYDYYAPGKPRVSGSIISLYRILQWYGNRWPDATLGILLHEVGHVLGLPSASSRYFITINDPRAKSRLDVGHCNSRECMMEQVNTPGRLDLLKKVDYVKRNNPDFFCKDDLEALRKNVKRLYSV